MKTVPEKGKSKAGARPPQRASNAHARVAIKESVTGRKSRKRKRGGHNDDADKENIVTSSGQVPGPHAVGRRRLPLPIV